MSEHEDEGDYQHPLDLQTNLNETLTNTDQTNFDTDVNLFLDSDNESDPQTPSLANNYGFESKQANTPNVFNLPNTNTNTNTTTTTTTTTSGTNSNNNNNVTSLNPNFNQNSERSMLQSQFSIMTREISMYSGKILQKISTNPDSLIPWGKYVDTLLLSLGLESMILLNKWDKRFASKKGLKQMDKLARNGALLEAVKDGLKKGQHLVLNRPNVTQEQIYVFYRAFMDLYPDLERKLFAFFILTVDEDLQHLQNQFFNNHDSLLLYCSISTYHIRSTAIGLQEREQKLHSDSKFLIQNPSEDPGIVASKLIKEITLINKLSGEIPSITERTKCVLFRKALNHTSDGRKFYANTFSTLDEKQISDKFYKVKQAIQDTYRDFVLPSIKQKKSGTAFNTNIYDSTENINLNTRSPPNSVEEFANPANHRNEQKKKLNDEGIEYGLCFDFMKTGKCERGSQCRYEHADRKSIKSMFADIDLNSNHHDHYDSTYYEDSYDQNDYTSEPSYDEYSHYANRQQSRNFRPRRGGKGGNRGRSFSKGGKGSKGKGGKPSRFSGYPSGKGGKRRQPSRTNQPRRPGLNWENTTSSTGTALSSRLSELANDVEVSSHETNDNYHNDNEHHYYANYVYDDHFSSNNSYDSYNNDDWYYDNDSY